MIKINVIVGYKNWTKYIKSPEIYLKKKIKKLNTEKFFKKKRLEFSLLLSNNKNIKKLNYKYRKKLKTTDVLSFPFHKKNDLKKILKKNNLVYLGDIIINLEVLINKDLDKNFREKFNEIWIHGLLHLLGYRHKLNSDYFRMKKIEKNYVDLLNR